MGSGGEGGEYKSMLVGYSQPPQAQGPFTVGKGAVNLEFRNPFYDSQEFTFSVDNSEDFVLKIPSKQKIDGGKSIQVGVEFKGTNENGSRLVVTHEKIPTPWIYFLKGQP